MYFIIIFYMYIHIYHSIIDTSNIITSLCNSSSFTLQPNETLKVIQVMLVHNKIKGKKECFYFSKKECFHFSKKECFHFSIKAYVTIPFENSTSTVCFEEKDCEFIHVHNQILN